MWKINLVRLAATSGINEVMPLVYFNNFEKTL